MGHLNVLGLVGLSAGQEALKLLTRLILIGPKTRAIETCGASLRGEERGEVGELPCLQADQLIAGLQRLQRARRPLAR